MLKAISCLVLVDSQPVNVKCTVMRDYWRIQATTADHLNPRHGRSRKSGESYMTPALQNRHARGEMVRERLSIWSETIVLAGDIALH